MPRGHLEGDYIDEVRGQWDTIFPGLDTSMVTLMGRISRIAQVVQARSDAVRAAQGIVCRESSRLPDGTSWLSVWPVPSVSCRAWDITIEPWSPPHGLAILIAALQLAGEVVVIADRALETTIGAVIAFLVILLTTRRQRAREREMVLARASRGVRRECLKLADAPQ